jgi:translation initiation factor 1
VSNDRLVYSTDGGDFRVPARRRVVKQHAAPALPDDGIARVFREKGGRGGKTVTVVRGLEGDLTAIAKELKRHCATGGSVKGAAIELQGDHRDKVVARLEAYGHRAKPAGG